MKAVTYQGIKNVVVKDVPDPKIEKSDDMIIKVTSTDLWIGDIFDNNIFNALIRYCLHAVKPPVLVFIRCPVKHPFAICFIRKEVHIADHDRVFCRELIQLILFAQLIWMEPLFGLN